ncbi:2-aminobenzoate-CoA ligase [Inhella inkyongensis]|uniref:2-aminobenzoate-CoA ligase n=1 Tax=Inhella inkyongensis TaxID=392593 RepID=A0A840S545_9BURK|nr:AMP-binding protein [Inhella inkyongensis]MBB5203609.1 2-aminobenzoate-CoA ligase [Inhella inkyongensis]
MTTAHIDRFAAEHLPPREQWPEFLFELPELQFPAQLNCATELLDKAVDERGWGGRLCVQGGGIRWTYRELREQANRIANVLVEDMGLQPGNRVLLRGPNHPMAVACWFAVMKAGGIAVATMPLLRAKELKTMIEIAQISHALCDAALEADLREAAAACPQLRSVAIYRNGAPDSLEARATAKAPEFRNVDTAADDTCILAFTSGTTGVPKATMHFHRDVMAICACWPRHVLKASADDVFMGSPPLGFTFGLGGLVLFPMSIGASSALLEKAAPPQLLEGLQQYGGTVLFTAPTNYRVLAQQGEVIWQTSLRRCVSAGEALPAATRALWREATGIELIDGIGATELLHIFISADEASARAGATGKAIPGYRAEVVDEQGRPLPVGEVGKLRVKGPTGCRYLNDARQASYVKDGWNYTGDAYSMDADGYFHYHARTDDMIISAGYNIAAPEVEEALMTHPAVAECGATGVADEERGQIVKACVVLKPGYQADAAMATALQEHVKASIAPYKYPRALVFVDQLPRTQTGKLQRFRLKDI